MSTYTTKHMTKSKTDNTFGLSYERTFYLKVEGKKIRVNDYGDKLHSLIDDLGWEYQRMGRSGREVYDEICHLLNMIPEDEVYMEI